MCGVQTLARRMKIKKSKQQHSIWRKHATPPLPGPLPHFVAERESDSERLGKQRAIKPAMRAVFTLAPSEKEKTAGCKSFQIKAHPRFIRAYFLWTN
jgi:hypothetical protein